MNKIVSIKTKAALLLVVFSANTLLGFACAVGLDSALLKRIIHHVEIIKDTESFLSVHIPGKQHHHNDEKEMQEKNCSCDNEKNGCCNKKVVSFEQLDKIISQSVAANFTPSVCELPPFLSLNTRIDCSTSNIVLSYIFKQRHSPPEDIRVFIRSFQI